MIDASMTRRVLATILMFAVSLTVLMGSGPGPGTPDARMPSDLVEVFGTNCEDQVIHITLASADPRVAKYVETQTSDDCVVTVGSVESLTVAQVRERLGLSGTTSEGSETADGQDAEGDTVPVYTNYHHSSHTIHDPVNIDLAWHRIDNKRYWTDDGVWFADSPNWPEYISDAGTGTGPDWWHLTGQGITETSSHCNSSQNCPGARVAGYASFRTTWAWCRPHQRNMTIYSTNWSLAGGGHYVETRRVGNCPGLHSSTAEWVDLSRTQ